MSNLISEILVFDVFWLGPHRITKKPGWYCWWRKFRTSWGWQFIPLFAGLYNFINPRWCRISSINITIPSYDADNLAFVHSATCRRCVGFWSLGFWSPFCHNHGRGKWLDIWKVTTIGDTSIFHWTMIMGGRVWLEHVERTWCSWVTDSQQKHGINNMLHRIHWIRSHFLQPLSFPQCSTPKKHLMSWSATWNIWRWDWFVSIPTWWGHTTACIKQPTRFWSLLNTKPLKLKPGKWDSLATKLTDSLLGIPMVGASFNWFERYAHQIWSS